LKEIAVADSDQSVEQGGGSASGPLEDPKIAALCAPLSDADPCGPDLDLDGDSDYLNFFANVEGVLPDKFFSEEDGSPFDRTTIDIPGQIKAMKPLLQRTRDIRLLILQARLSILNKDLAGFAQNLAATAWWLEKFWGAVHPQPVPGDFAGRATVVGTLELPTVIFPLQYAPLLEGRRVGQISYRAWMIAKGEVKARPGDLELNQSAITDAVAAADPAALAATRKDVALVKTSVDSIRNTFYANGQAPGLEKLAALAKTIQEFIDPQAAAPVVEAADGADAGDSTAAAAAGASGTAPASLAQARDALAAIAGYYSRSEPSSPILLLVRQAHDLIGKSFFEVMNVLVPSHVERAAFHIGGDQFFELPLERLSSFAETPSAPEDGGEEPGEDSSDEGASEEGAGEESSGRASSSAEPASQPRYTVASRAQAIALLDQVHQYFRRFEPASPVPMLCERARALAEQNFMDVLRNVLPRDALRNINDD
jgi:type VI secretion system protein ImpA